MRGYQKKKCPGREVKDLLFFLSEGHRGSFSRILLCDFFFIFVGGGGVLIHPPLPDLRMDWEVAEKAL